MDAAQSGHPFAQFAVGMMHLTQGNVNAILDAFLNLNELSVRVIN